MHIKLAINWILYHQVLFVIQRLYSKENKSKLVIRCYKNALMQCIHILKTKGTKYIHHFSVSTELFRQMLMQTVYICFTRTPQTSCSQTVPLPFPWGTVIWITYS